MTPLAPGARVGGFVVRELLGRGGMGAVYRARDEQSGRDVALKVVARQLATNEAFLERFRLEARAAASVSHPNVARIYSASVLAGRDEGPPFIALELIEGGSLASRLKTQGRLHWREVAKLGAGIARGLAAIHSAGLVHRDVKPANVLLDREGAPKLADFGLVRVVAVSDQTPPGSLTATGEVIGTYEFLSPEQADGRKDVDARADLYGLGATLYALLAGRPPFAGQGLALLRQHLTVRPTPLRDELKDVPRALDRLVLKLLEKDPQKRGTELETASALDEIAAGGVAPVGRRSVAIATIAAVAALAVAASIGVASSVAPRDADPVVATPSPKTGEKTPIPIISRTPTLDARGGSIVLGRASEWSHASPVVVLAISDDGKLGASGTKDETIRVFDVANMREVRALSAGYEISAIAIDDRRVVAGLHDGRVVEWKISSSDAAPHRVDKQPSRILALKIDRGGAIRFAAGSQYGVIGAAPSPTGTSPAHQAAFGRGDEERVLVAGQAKVRRVSGLDQREIDVASDAWNLALDPTGSRALVNRAGGSTISVNLVTGEQRPLANEGMTSVAFLDASTALLGCELARAVVVVDLDRGVELRRIRAPVPFYWSCFAVARDGTTIASFDGIVRKLDVAHGRVIAPEGDGHDGLIHALAFTADGRLASGADDDFIRVWDLGARHAATITFGSRVTALAASKDGKLIAGGGADVALFGKTPLQAVWRVPNAHGGQVVKTLAFSPTGKHAASGGEDGCVRLYSARYLASDRSIGAYPDERDIRAWVWSVAFVSDDRVAALGIAGRSSCKLALFWANAENTFAPTTLDAQCTQLAPADDSLFAAGIGGHVLRIDIATRETTGRTHSPLGKEIRGLAFARATRRLFVLADTKLVALDADDLGALGDPLDDVAPLGDLPISLALSQDEKRIAVGTVRGSIRVFDVPPRAR